MTSYQKWKRYEEALRFERNKLNEDIEKYKQINADYSGYLKDNPYKEDRNKLAKRKEEHTQKILELIDIGFEKYKP